MKKVFLILSVVILVGLLALTYLSVSVVQRKEPQETRSEAAPSTVLSLIPATSTQYTGQSFTTDVKVNTGTNQIVSADLALNFSPQVLEATSVTMGSFLPGATEIQKTIDNTTGKITYSFYTFTANARQGQGVLASVTFKGKAPGNSSVSFGPQTAIGALGENQNVVTSMTPANYTVQNDTAPPAAVSNLRITSTTMQTIALAWTAPGDAGPTGKADSYDLRYSNSSINDSSWASATPVTGLPVPGSPGTQESVTISNLTLNTSYFFGLKSKDAANNVSSLSNIVSGTTLSKPNLNFKIKFQGITSQKPNQLVKIILKQAGVIKYTFPNVSTSSNPSGIYSGTIVEIDPGTYDPFVKGPVHLQEKFASVTLNPGANSQDWSGTILKAGDIDGNNTVNAVDIARVIEDYFPNTPIGSPADFNLDGTVNAIDIGFVIENYFQQGD